MINLQEDWQQMSPGWREKQIHDCLCGIKTALETVYAQQPLVYRALLTQTSSNAPTAIVLENTLGEVPTFGYGGAGKYTLNTVGTVFTTDKTFVTNNTFPNQGDETTIFAAQWSSEILIELATYRSGANDDLLVKTPIEIIVYP